MATLEEIWISWLDGAKPQAYTLFLESDLDAFELQAKILRDLDISEPMNFELMKLLAYFLNESLKESIYECRER